MKNLKRVLSLALSGIMLVGMMAVSASAVNAKDFSDADEITHTEAVNVMSTLGVLKGKDTGAYDPTATVTRAEMAKIICVMLNGGVDPTLGTSSTAKFTDVPTTHWARSYIEYCANLGVIAGRGDGTFGPDEDVSGAAAAKMLLVALGYDSDIFGFTGSDWELNVNSEANKIKLYDEIRGIDTSAGLSRDDTAQMAYNALEARIMVRGAQKVVSTGEISYDYNLSDRTTFLNEYFNAYTWVGQLDGNHSTDDGIPEGHIQVSGDLDTADTSVKDYEPTPANFPSDFDISNIGEEVKVIFKDGRGGTSKQPDKNDTIYGVFNTGATEVVTAIKADVKDNHAEEAKIKIGSTKYNLADTVTVWTNYVGAGDKYEADGESDNDTKGSSEANSDLTDALKATTGDALKLILKDGKVNRIYVTESILAVVTSKNATKITLNNGVGTLTIADHDIADDVDVDDVVEVTVLYSAKATDDNAYVTVTKADTVEGEVSGFKDKENVKLDGTTYKIYGNAAMKDLGLDDQKTEFADSLIGEDFTLYLVNGYVYAAVQTSESASNYSVILEVSGEGKVGSTLETLRLAVMDATGAKTTIVVSEDSKETKSDKYKAGSIITYTTDKNGQAVVKIVADYAEANKNSSAGAYKKNTKAFDDTVTASDAVLFVTTKEATEDGLFQGVKAYKIRDLGNFEAKAENWVSYEKDGKVVAVFANNEEAPSGATSSRVYGIVSAYNGTVKVDGNTYLQFVVDSNSKQYKINIPSEDEVLADKNAKGLIVSFEPSSDDIYSKGAVTKVEAKENEVVVGYVDSYDRSDKIITVFTELQGLNAEGKDEAEDENIVSWKGKTSKTYAVDDDVEIYYVDQDNDKGVESGSITKFDTVAGLKNIILVIEGKDDDAKVTVMIVETSGEKDII